MKFKLVISLIIVALLASACGTAAPASTDTSSTSAGSNQPAVQPLPEAPTPGTTNWMAVTPAAPGSKYYLVQSTEATQPVPVAIPSNLTLPDGTPIPNPTSYQGGGDLPDGRHYDQAWGFGGVAIGSLLLDTGSGVVLVEEAEVGGAACAGTAGAGCIIAGVVIIGTITYFVVKAIIAANAIAYAEDWELSVAAIKHKDPTHAPDHPVGAARVAGAITAVTTYVASGGPNGLKDLACMMYKTLAGFLGVINKLTDPILSRIMPDLGEKLKGKSKLSWKQLLIFSATVPFILGLDDFAGYVPLFSVINVYGFAIGVISAHTILNIALFLSPAKTIQTVKNEYISFAGTIAFIGLAFYGFWESGRIILEMFH